MNKTIQSIAIALTTILACLPTLVSAQEAEPQPLENAVWITPQDTQAPWLDLRTNHVSPTSYQILESGKSIVLITDGEGKIFVADTGLKIQGTITFPEQTKWFTVDEKDRIFAHDGKSLYVAESWKDAAQADGFKSVLDISGIRSIDTANDTVVYADADELSIISLADGSMKKIKLTDFMDEAKLATMTPEALLAAQSQKNAKKKTSTKQSKKAEEPAQAQTQVADIQGIWWRHDGTGIIRIRSILTNKTLITKDNGLSWNIASDAPATLTHSFGWLWNGEDRVLSKDGTQWLQVKGPAVYPATRWIPTHSLVSATELSEGWTMLESPEVPKTPAVEAPENAENAEPAQEPAIVEVAMIPQTGIAPDLTDPSLDVPLYTPIAPEGGFDIGLYRDAIREKGSDKLISAPTAWMTTPDRGSEIISLPEGCIPEFASASMGLGILLCRTQDDEYLGYVRTADTDWQAEIILPNKIGQNTKILAAEDGSLTLLGACGEETEQIPVMPTQEEMDQGIFEERMESRTAYVCNAAVRLPRAVGQENIWRIEHMENAYSFIPMSNGRLISMEGASSSQRSLTLRTAESTGVIVDQFDATPYSGLVVTNEGCLALYDGSVPAAQLREDFHQERDPETGVPMTPMGVRLLSTSGRLSGTDCTISREAAELAVNQTTVEEPAKGDDHYGVRAGAGAFFASGVQTWFANIEALIPLFSGQYEVGLRYRIAGGNTSTSFGHIGMVSVRWRYDALENFDFAVGAGLGYGTMCGYDSSKDPGAIDEDEETLPSAYEGCNAMSMRYAIGGLATYKINPNWKIFIAAELLGGTNWGVDLSAGLEIRF